MKIKTMPWFLIIIYIALLVFIYFMLRLDFDPVKSAVDTVKLEQKITYLEGVIETNEIYQDWERKQLGLEE